MRKSDLVVAILIMFLAAFFLGARMPAAYAAAQQSAQFSEDSSPTADQSSDSGPTPSLAPLNPEFLQYVQNDQLSRQQNSTSGGYPFGHMPSPLNLEHARGMRIQTAYPQVHQLAASYDLRTLGRVSPVKDQGTSGSCWAHSTIASIESCLMPAETRDFSENNLKDLAGFDLGWNAGGNRSMATAYFTRWSGPVNESDDPYDAYSGYSPLGLPVQKHLQNVLYIPDRASATDNDNIKTAIMTHGGIDTAMYMDESSDFYNDATTSFYYNGSSRPNHEVCIVGWNDNYPASNFSNINRPAGNGAWLAKNSWGTSWGNNGYFYVSYYDTVFTKESTCFYDAQTVTNYSTIYQYDPLGCVANGGYSSTTAWFANVFTAANSRPISAVSFYSLSPSSTYTVSVYVDPTNGPLSASGPVVTQSGTCNMGYFTIPLNAQVAVAQGHKFSVVVQINTPGNNSPIPMEYPLAGYSGTATANAGESYISSNGISWSDLTTFSANTNTCIKAFSVYSTTPPSGLTATQVSSTQINLSWTDNSNNETGFRIERKTGSAGTYVEIAVVGPNITTYHDTGLTPNTTYYYRVRAYSGSGNSAYSNEVSASTSVYTVTPSVGANGTLSPNTVQTVNSGSSLTFSAVPNTGYAMGVWTVDGTTVQTGGRTYTLSNITANHSVAVTFIVFTPKITPSAGANGTISPSTVQTVTYGSSLTLTATPNTGYAVGIWSVDGTAVQTGGTTYTLSNIIASHTVSVTFVVFKPIVTPSAGTNGTLSPSTATAVTYGSSLTLTATPNSGYIVNAWSVDGVSAQTGGTTYTLSNITANHTVAVTFKVAPTYTVTPSVGANGTLTPNTAQTVSSGSSMVFSAVPNTGYAMGVWTVDGTTVQTGGRTYTLSNITANHTVAVTFIVFTPKITPSAGANGSISPSAAQAVTYGSSLTLTATPNAGYAVGVWSVDGVSAQTGGTTYTLSNIIASHTVSVTFVSFKPTVTPSAGTNGTISPSTAQTVTYGSSLKLTATPTTGYIVNAWSVDGVSAQTGGTTYTLSNITANHTVAVTFKVAPTYTVTPSVGANGTLTPNTAQTVSSGSSMVFSAVPNTGYAMGVWSVDGTTVQTGGRTYTLSNITANHTVAVTFIVFTPKITPSAGANGTISPSTAQTVTYGSSLTLTATPNSGYAVNAWSVDGTSVQTGGMTYTLSNIIGSHTVSVTFKAASNFTVTPSVGANGTLTPNTAQTVSSGSSLVFNAVPNTGYAMGVWSVDGTTVQTGGRTYTLSNITANHTVAVTFIVFTPKITPSAGANGSISPSTAQTVTYGSSLTLTATPNSGYAVNAWSVDGTSVQTGGTTYTLSNIIGSHTVSVTFKAASNFTVTPSVGANGTLTPNTAQTVSSGSSLVFNAVPNTGYAMGVWSVDGTTVQTGGRTYTLSNITANHTVAVTFIVFTPKITPSAGANGTISPSTAQTVTYGSSLTLTATPNTGYTVNAWSVDGTSVQTGGTTYTLSNIIGSHTVSVTFK